ncbi:MAG: 4-hydroxybenzoate octaprenyltransferase [Acidobacteria bacterium]|nr:MAG: 4-hydroxybenzoate octaprenyltransferase [Acidobacteriota bacterium]
MIKIEHSVFALPFALVSAFLAADGVPDLKTLILILVAMVSARSAAMAFNRYLDAEIDARNPRTQIRSIPAGRLSKSYVLAFTIGSIVVFVAACYFLNFLSWVLSPVVMLVLLGYSYTKRFTPLCHLVLGLALGLAPVGAWVAVTGTLDWIPVLLGVTVMFWTAGFDIIYACQDEAFDRQHKLHSIPVMIGVSNSLCLSRFLHLLSFILLMGFGYLLSFMWIYWAGLVLVGVTLFYEHYLVRGDDLSKVNMAFFTMNGVVSLVFGGMTIAALLVAL